MLHRLRAPICAAILGGAGCASDAAPPPRPPQASSSRASAAPASELPAGWLSEYPELRRLLPERDLVMKSESVIDRRPVGDADAFHEYGVVSTHGAASCLRDAAAAVASLGGKPSQNSRPGWFEAEGPVFYVEATVQDATCQVQVKVPLIHPQKDMAALARGLPGYAEAESLRALSRRSAVFVYVERTEISGATHVIFEIFGIHRASAFESWLSARGFARCGEGGVLSASVEYARTSEPSVLRLVERDSMARLESRRATRGGYVGMRWPHEPEKDASCD
jgi:hypothetical protein